MTVDAGRWDIKGDMIWIGGVVVISLVTTHTGVGCVIIVSARVTAVAIDSRVCSGQRVIIIVDRE